MTWPDHGAPDESDFKIIEKVLDYMREFHQRSIANNGENKIVIHCSAGIGRSGTILSIYNIQLALEKLFKNK
jgi:protein-tyrosine phosphatase